MKAKYITPAVTILNEDRTPNLAETAKVYEHLIQGGSSGILLMGSIGEFFAFTMEQKKALIENAVKVIDHRLKLLVGTTSMVFDEIIELSRFAKEAGADSVIILPPYYFPIDEAGVEAYYGRIAELLPDQEIYIYNFPQRTGYDISAASVKRIAQAHSNIKGIKDTQTGMDHTREVIKAVKDVRPDFEVYSGFDDNFSHNVLSGGDGCIAGLSNIFPRLTHAWVQAFEENDTEKISEIQKNIDCLMEVYAVGPSFVPIIKAAMEEKEIIHGTASAFPFPEVSEAQREAIRVIFNKAGV